VTAPTHRTARASSARRTTVVRFGDVAVGGHSVPVIAPPGTGADVDCVVAPAGVAAVGSTDAAAIVDVTGVGGGLHVVDAVARTAAGIVVGDSAGRHAAHAAAARRSGTPVVLRLGALGDGAGAADGDAGPIDAVVVDVEHASAIERARHHYGVPVLARLCSGADAAAAGPGAGVGGLAGVAVAAGADALWLSGSVSAADVAQAREAAARLGPLVRPAVPDTLGAGREVIDGIDAVIATLLEYRVGVAGRIQQLKPVGGHAGRDRAREAEIVTAMARRAPSLSRAAIEAIVAAVIEAGLEAAERSGDDDPPVWRG